MKICTFFILARSFIVHNCWECDSGIFEYIMVYIDTLKLQVNILSYIIYFRSQIFYNTFEYIREWRIFQKYITDIP